MFRTEPLHKSPQSKKVTILSFANTSEARKACLLAVENNDPQQNTILRVGNWLSLVEAETPGKDLIKTEKAIVNSPDRSPSRDILTNQYNFLKHENTGENIELADTSLDNYFKPY